MPSPPATASAFSERPELGSEMRTYFWLPLILGCGCRLVADNTLHPKCYRSRAQSRASDASRLPLRPAWPACRPVKTQYESFISSASIRARGSPLLHLSTDAADSWHVALCISSAPCLVVAVLWMMTWTAVDINSRLQQNFAVDATLIRTAEIDDAPPYAVATAATSAVLPFDVQDISWYFDLHPNAEYSDPFLLNCHCAVNTLRLSHKHASVDAESECFALSPRPNLATLVAVVRALQSVRTISRKSTRRTGGW
jgi:hypothetical protein